MEQNRSVRQYFAGKKSESTSNQLDFRFTLKRCQNLWQKLLVSRLVTKTPEAPGEVSQVSTCVPESSQHASN